MTTLKNIASICSQLVRAKEYYSEMALYYHSLFNQMADCDPDSLLPNSPLAELCQKLSQYNMSQIFVIEARIMALDNIAAHTMINGLDY